jgi:beta-glucosidase
VTFPRGLSQIPTADPTQFPGVNGKVLYSEGIDVGYRWYDAHGVTPLFPFGFGLSYTQFRFSNLQVTPTATDGVSDVQVSATITNVGHRAGADVAQLYLGDPPATGEPPRQLVGFRRVALNPGQSTRVQFTITPRDTWWWDLSANGWNQSAGHYKVYVGDSSALSDLPLTGAFNITATPGARQVVIKAPATIQRGRATRVRVRLTAGGNETLRNVTIALQLAEGWTARAVNGPTIRRVRPGEGPVVTFWVTPPIWAPVTNAVIHATAQLGPDAQREAGVTVTVR